MNTDRTEYFRRMLEEQHSDLEHTISTLKNNQTSDQDVYSPSELSNYDNHPADLGTDLYQVEFNNGIMVHEEYMMREIHDALGRIDDGLFGACLHCGKPIDEERLEIIPYARLCMECEESKAETQVEKQNDRPVEELVLDAPFGRKYLNRREDDEYEGSDYLNDLIKYGTSDTPQDMGGYHDYKGYYTNKTDKQGVVDDMDQVSNEEYKKQLPD